MDIIAQRMKPRYFYIRNVDISSIDAKYDIKDNKLKTNYTFTDEMKNNRECVIVNPMTSKKCWWCRETIEKFSIQCPTQAHYNIKVDKYYSQVKKTFYDIKEIVNDTPPSFTVDGLFCSFSCCLAYINDNSYNILYKNSTELLHQMHFIMYNKYMTDVIPAPHWRLLQDYGGNMDIQTFRNSSNSCSQIINHGIVTIPLGMIYEKKITF